MGGILSTQWLEDENPPVRGDFARVPGVPQGSPRGPPGVPGLGQHFVQNVSELFFSQDLGHGFTGFPHGLD